MERNGVSPILTVCKTENKNKMGGGSFQKKKKLSQLEPIMLSETNQSQKDKYVLPDTRQSVYNMYIDICIYTCV